MTDPFVCPQCGSEYFSTDADGTVRCNGESSAGPRRCDWRGEWPPAVLSQED